MRRLLLLALVAACLAPGTWVRSPVPRWNNSQEMSVTRLNVHPANFGEWRFQGGWRLDSPNSGFGSYSALLGMDDGRLLAASDSGGLLQFPKPGASGQVKIGRFAGRAIRRKNLVDIESLTRDPVSGQIWAGYEGTNSIERLDADLSRAKSVRPASMSGWRSNAGPEAMARLADGRFIVLSEGPRRWLGDAYPGLLFPVDPVSGAIPLEFVFDSEGGFAPVDMVQIPDGRVLVLVRKLNLGLPPSFSVKLIVADPAEIAANNVWTGRVLGKVESPDIRDNYEGMMVQLRADGLIDIWLISDDNNAVFQRTLLLHFRWDPETDAGMKDRPGGHPTKQKAHEKPARPSQTH